MDWYRVRHTIGMYLTRTGQGRAKYIQKHRIFRRMGDSCMVMFRKIPLHPHLISVGNNVWIASNVLLITHDVAHRMLNNRQKDAEFEELLGCIEIGDNVFIGSNTTVLPDVRIGSNTVVAAGSVVSRDLPGNGVYAGVPARYICSLEEFIKKRRSLSKTGAPTGTSGTHLSEEIVEACWKDFREKRKEHQRILPDELQEG